MIGDLARPYAAEALAGRLGWFTGLQSQVEPRPESFRGCQDTFADEPTSEPVVRGRYPESRSEGRERHLGAEIDPRRILMVGDPHTPPTIPTPGVRVNTYRISHTLGFIEELVVFVNDPGGVAIRLGDLRVEAQRPRESGRFARER